VSIEWRVLENIIIGRVCTVYRWGNSSFTGQTTTCLYALRKKGAI